jgi:hypothetical protein
MVSMSDNKLGKTFDRLFSFATFKSEEDYQDYQGYHFLRHLPPVIVFLMMSKSINSV